MFPSFLHVRSVTSLVSGRPPTFPPVNRPQNGLFLFPFKCPLSLNSVTLALAQARKACFPGYETIFISFLDRPAKSLLRWQRSTGLPGGLHVLLPFRPTIPFRSETSVGAAPRVVGWQCIALSIRWTFFNLAPDPLVTRIFRGSVPFPL